MTKTEILSKLCYYDKRNPDYDADSDQEIRDKGECFCDDCFYGRSKLANEILEMRDVLESILLHINQNQIDLNSSGYLKQQIESVMGE